MMETKIYGQGECAICQSHISKGVLMCREHWFKVLYLDRISVYEKLGQYQYNPSEANLEILRKVQDSAVKFVESML